MNTLVLLDAHALIHRAYHALPKFTSKNTGEPTGALYGLSSMLIKSIRELKPDYLIAAFDLPGLTFRHSDYEAYKANRKEADDDLKKQLERAHDVVSAFGIHSYSSPGFEADDVIGTIAEQCPQLSFGHDLKIILVSGDMDILQLVDDGRVVVYTMRKGLDDTVIYDEKRVMERYGFRPKQIPDYKGLRGDASDNIMGVPGIGEKIATEIIKNFGDLENLYAKIDEATAGSKLKTRILRLLIDHRNDAFFSKTLATIRRDAPVTFKIPEAKFELQKNAVTMLFTDLGFNSLIARI